VKSGYVTLPSPGAVALADGVAGNSLAEIHDAAVARAKVTL
jgi:hypothetical protein